MALLFRRATLRESGADCDIKKSEKGERVKFRYFAAAALLTFALGAGVIRLPRSFSADFIQKISNPSGKTISYSGKVFMNSPDSMKWIYEKPSRKEVCSDGKRVTVVDHDLEQISIYRLKSGLDLSSVLSKAKHYKDNIYTANYEGKIYTIALDSKGRVEQIAYRDDMDNVVNIHFYEIKYVDKPFERDRLECRLPPAYDRIGG